MSDVEKIKREQPCPVTVEVIERDKKSVLIAWMDEGQYRRAYAPANKLSGNEIDGADLEKCPPYGLPWEKLLSGLPNADAIANDLRRRQIWTAQDFKRGRAEVNAAIQKMCINPFVDELVKEL